MKLLARRDFCSSELQSKLERQGFDTAVVLRALVELVDERILDDARYAERYIRYHADRGQGPVRIAADLKALGLSRDLIDTAMAAGPDWPSVAREVRIRKFGLSEPTDWARKARQARFLQYRGFSSDHIRLALGADVELD